MAELLDITRLDRHLAQGISSSFPDFMVASNSSSLS
jgi:hypothetical protein